MTSKTCKKTKNTKYNKCIDNEGTYNGHLKNGKYAGYGKYIWKNDGSTYLGHWNNDLFNGKGTMHNKTTDIVSKGSWKNHKLNGIGIMQFNKFNKVKKNIVYVGATSSGMWKNHKLNGIGKQSFRTKNGSTHIESGLYKNGKLNGTCKFATSKKSHRGNCKNGKLNGRVTVRIKNRPSSNEMWKNHKLILQ